jgi:predicted nucleic acid-binding protein
MERHPHELDGDRGDAPWRKPSRRHDFAQAISLDTWIAEVVEWLEDRIFPVDRPVAEVWAMLMVPDPRSPIDALIAATARARGLTLVTRNIRDFEGIGVALVDPWDFAV